MNKDSNIDKRKLVKKRRRKISLVIALSFLIFFNIISYLRNKYHHEVINETKGSGFTLDVGKAKALGNPLPKLWKFKAGDDTRWKNRNTDDSDWSLVNPEFNLDSSYSKEFNGIGWFRVKFRSSLKNQNQIIVLQIEHFGASEFYLDERLIYSSGIVSADPEKEDGVISRLPIFIPTADTLEHLLCARYSNHNYLKYKDRFGAKLAGFSINNVTTPQGSMLSLFAGEKISFWFIALFVFFLTLAIVHLLLFLFYPIMRENLYYSLFVFLFSSIIFCLYLLISTENPAVYLSVIRYYLVLLVSFLLSIGLCLYSLFKPTLWKRMMIIQISISLICLVTSFAESLKGIAGLFIFANLLFTCIEAVRTVVFAIKRKMMGARIIGTGVLIFFMFIFILVMEGVIVGTVEYGGEDSTAEYLMILSLLSIISIPISMSIYLAYVFSNTNRSLAVKLEEVEELSARSIAQEKEKQQILADQNLTLEKQVKERTAEIHEQKKVIEEKNKDIIDSINYAKRIQAAMLPEESVFNQIFVNSFVIYEPRDIVSGDFYYATEINNKKLIIAADCTGHGVPGALMSMVGCNIINKLAHENGIVDPKLLIESLHVQLRQALKQDLAGSVNRDGMDVAAVLIDEKKITYAGANRPLIWFKNNNELMEIKPDKTPVGGSHINRIELRNHVLDTDDVKELFLFSDGFADQFGGPDHTIGGKKLMVSRFKQWLKEIIELQSDDQAKFLKSGFDQWRGNNEQVDDVMVIGIKP